MLPVLVFYNNPNYSKNFKATGKASALPLRTFNSSQNSNSFLTKTFWHSTPGTLLLSNWDPNAKSQTKVDPVEPDGKHGIHSVLLITDPDACN
jgi:hypothetical protein